LSNFYPCTIVYKGMSFRRLNICISIERLPNIQIFIWQNKFGMQRQPMKLKSFPNLSNHLKISFASNYRSCLR
jgi:histidinol phosphatase-like enzyme